MEILNRIETDRLSSHADHSENLSLQAKLAHSHIHLFSVLRELDLSHTHTYGQFRKLKRTGSAFALW